MGGRAHHSVTVQGLSSRARCEGFGAGTAYARATVAAAPAQRHVVSRCCRRQPITPHRPAHLLAVREGSCHLHYAFRNTEEKARYDNLGCMPRGRRCDGYFNHK